MVRSLISNGVLCPAKVEKKLREHGWRTTKELSEEWWNGHLSYAMRVLNGDADAMAVDYWGAGSGLRFWNSESGEYNSAPNWIELGLLVFESMVVSVHSVRVDGDYILVFEKGPILIREEDTTKTYEQTTVPSITFALRQLSDLTKKAGLRSRVLTRGYQGMRIIWDLHKGLSTPLGFVLPAEDNG
jgi:hypothetical protein